MASEVVAQEESLLPMLFEDIHESGRIERIVGKTVFFRFQYRSTFYGLCTFTAKLVEGTNQPLRLDRYSISLETYELKKGNCSRLVSVAEVFFTAMLVNYSSLNQLRADPRFEE